MTDGGRGMFVLALDGDDFTLGYDEDDIGCSVSFVVGDSLDFFFGEGLLPPALNVRVGDPIVLLPMMKRRPERGIELSAGT